MKRLICLITALVLVTAVFTGCADMTGGASTDTSASAKSGDSAETADNADNGFDAFVDYMTENEYIKGEGEELKASAIGAARGKRYTVSANGAKIYVELYEYTDQSSSIASKTIASARNGVFDMYSDSIAAQKTVAAVSEDGRYLMLYTDTSSNANNIDTKNKAMEAVRSYKK